MQMNSAAEINPRLKLSHAFALDRLISPSKAGGEGSCSRTRNVMTRCFIMLLKLVILYFILPFSAWIFSPGNQLGKPVRTRTTGARIAIVT